ncbi:MAG: septum formation initiator family protein [Terracidiphilus sp.]
MQVEKAQAGKNKAEDETVSVFMLRRALNFARRAWRPAASVVAVALALLLGWHAVYGKNGLSVWEQKRVEDRQLRKEIDDLNQENTRLRERIERLQSNPDAIGQVARDKLHYAKPNEVIVTLPPEKQPQPQPAGTSK